MANIIFWTLIAVAVVWIISETVKDIRRADDGDGQYPDLPKKD